MNGRQVAVAVKGAEERDSRFVNQRPATTGKLAQDSPYATMRQRARDWSRSAVERFVVEGRGEGGFDGRFGKLGHLDGQLRPLLNDMNQLAIELGDFRDDRVRRRDL